MSIESNRIKAFLSLKANECFSRERCMTMCSLRRRDISDNETLPLRPTGRGTWWGMTELRIAPIRGFISVGTVKSFSHPRQAYLKALTNSGCRTVCSEIARHCDPETVRSGTHVLQGSGALGLPANRTGFSCRGTWRAYFRDGLLIPDQFDEEHKARVANLRRPLCV